MILAIKMQFRARSIAWLVISVLLGACGGGGNGSGSSVSNAAPARGMLLDSPPELLSTVTAPALLLQLNAASNQQLLALSDTPVCDVLVYHIRYTTIGG
ncbi:MAG TPA: hypothetical protein VN750_20945, partial [Steroidobacteraceae bacterium]|nr:hypothetical protein [Steroidobacteraceae bacterium]